MVAIIITFVMKNKTFKYIYYYFTTKKGNKNVESYSKNEMDKKDSNW